MSENMRLISFEHLVNWCLEEYKKEGKIFGIREEKFYRNKSGNYLKTVFGDKLGSAVGPAAGPPFPAGTKYYSFLFVRFKIYRA